LPLVLTRRSRPVVETSQPYLPHKVTTVAGTAAMEQAAVVVVLALLVAMLFLLMEAVEEAEQNRQSQALAHTELEAAVEAGFQH